MKSKQELENDFHWWITCIPDNIDYLEKLIPEKINSQLDFSVGSLHYVGKYLVETETLDSIKKNIDLWNAFASYIGVVYEKNVPTAKWYVELEDERNLYYGVPALRTDAKTNFYPQFEITTMLDRKRPELLEIMIKKHIELQNPI